MRLGIVAALPAEAECLSVQSPQYQDISNTASLPEDSGQPLAPLCCISGIGSDAARTAAAGLVERGATALLSWGCAGALSETLKPGDLLLPETIVAEDGQVLHTHAQWRSYLQTRLTGTLTCYGDVLVESRQLVSGYMDKQRLAGASGAIAVDMESAAVGRVAAQSGIPFMVIRAVADAADEGLPPCIAQTMDHQGQLQIRRMLPMLIRQPGMWPQLFRLGRHFHAATRTLTLVSTQADSLFHIR